MLISEETIELINKIIQRMFSHNRTWDRALGFMSTEWAFDNFNKTFHGGLAHLYPLLADKVSDILLRYNISPKYYETPSDTREYESMLEFFNTNINEHIKTYDLIKEAINTATLNGDINVEADLKEIVRIWNRFIEQSIVLRDKAQMFDKDLAMFDGFADQFYVLSEVKDMLSK